MKKAISIFTVAAMTVTLLAGCGSASSTTAASAAAPATSEASTVTTTSTDAASIADSAAASTTKDLSQAKVGVCIYQFSDNFMTLFRNELEK